MAKPGIGSLGSEAKKVEYIERFKHRGPKRQETFESNEYRISLNKLVHYHLSLTTCNLNVLDKECQGREQQE